MGSFREQYLNRKPKFLNDSSINKANRDLFTRFFDFEETKLKRINDLRELDENCYKTLYDYICRLTSVNLWFGNKDLSKITKEDIEKVFNDLEDGKIKNARGKPFKERKCYYNKIFKGKLFKMIGKDEFSREVMEFHKPNGDGETRFITHEDFLKLADTAIKLEHKLLLWLAWDIGENVNALLKLKKRDFVRTINENKEIEYRINLSRENIKRSRTSRGEITNYKETAQYLDNILSGLKDDEDLFKFEYRMAKKFFDRAVRITNIKCQPKGQNPSWKDLRSGMACNLLKQGWNRDEVNSRLGHKPSSREIDKYINFLALDKHKPKRKLYDNQLQQVLKQLEEMQFREKLMQTRYDRMDKENLDLKEQINQALNKIKEIEKLKVMLSEYLKIAKKT